MRLLNLNFGMLENKKGNYDQAIEAYQKTIQIKPDYSNAWFNKGSAFRKSSGVHLR